MTKTKARRKTAKSRAATTRTARTKIVDGLRAKVKRLERELEAAEDRADEAEAEVENLDGRDDGISIPFSMHEPLAHARSAIEKLTAPDPFALVMNQRSVDAITELLGDR